MPRTTSERYQRWRIDGKRVGHIRSGIYYIDRTVHGRRYKVSTGCLDPSAAELEYRRFEIDPAHYVPRSGSGTCCSSCALNCARVHQQGACADPGCVCSIAHRLGLPHSGQWQGSMAEGGFMG